MNLITYCYWGASFNDLFIEVNDEKFPIKYIENDDVKGRVQGILDSNNGKLNLGDVKVLQGELRDLIGEAQKSGKTLNEFFTDLVN